MRACSPAVVRLSPLALSWLLALPACKSLDFLTGSTGEEETAATSTGSPTSDPSAGSSTPHAPSPGPTTGVTAPELRSPQPGSEIPDSQPTLVVINSTTDDPTTPTYRFEVARDPNFAQVASASAEVPQGSSGETAWTVQTALEPAQYFWRVQAKSGVIRSPYSAIGDFTVTAPPVPGPDSENVLLFDPLASGMSLGEVNGGAFVDEGWQVRSKSDYIRYQIPSLSGGYVAWDNRGLRPTNPSPDNFMLFGMWDPTRGDYRTNPYRVHIQKLDTQHNPPYIRLRWIANGEQHDRGFDFLNWDPDAVYRWRIEWGPEGSANMVRVFLNGQVIIQQRYQNTYQPKTHWVELGIAERRESIVGAIYDNVEIGSR